MTLTLALSYGGREEIAQVVRDVAGAVARGEVSDHGLKRQPRFDQRAQLHAAPLGEQVDVACQQRIGGPGNERAAIAPGAGLHQALRFEDAQRFAQ